MSERILLTGGSSFTGVWIAEALAAAGFEVLAPLLRPQAGYRGVRLERVQRLQRVASVLFDTPFGGERFLQALAAQGRVDVLVHHAAQIEGYRDPNFDPVDALARNTRGAPAVLGALRAAGGRAVVVTGTVFEAGEGGEPASPAVTPYGLSKTLTTVAYRYWAGEAGLRFGRVVIPSPYGPLEEPRFCWHLFRSWFAGEPPAVRTPLYVRDHIAAPQLARAYADLVRAMLDGGQDERVARPSGWIATQGEFAKRVAAESAARLGLECRLTFANQTAFDEPRVRVNTEPVGATWEEAAFWDAYVGWYDRLRREGALR